MEVDPIVINDINMEDNSIESVSSAKSTGSSQNAGSSQLDAGSSQMDIEIIETKLNSSTGSAKLLSVTSQNGTKSSAKKVKKTKEERDRENKEREAKKAKEEEEKRIRREKREKELEQSRQKKEEKRRQIEANRIEREEKRKQKELENEEKKKVAEQLRIENEQKKADKLRELEMRRLERDEKKRQEEEQKAEKKKQDEEKERKKLKEANRFQSFFKKVSPQEKKNSKVGNFELQKDQSIASLVPEQVKESFCVGAFDSVISHQDAQQLYLHEIRNKTRLPIKRKCLIRNSLNNKKDNDVTCENDDYQTNKKTYKAKLLQFHENNRPAYFGTWRKKCEKINGRKIFGEYDKFDYTVDSDDEWEEEEKGESIKDSESEGKVSDEEDEIDDYELDEFFVPHGHLSDDENQEDAEFVEVEETPDGQKKRKLLTKEKLLIEERTKKLKRLVPKAIGCLFWQQDEFENKAKFSQFEKYKVCFVN